MNKEQPDYLSYALRLWRPSSKEKAIWRASLESFRTHERKNFASMAELFGFLGEQTGGLSEADGICFGCLKNELEM